MIAHDGRPDNQWRFEIQALRSEMAALRDNNLDPRLSWAQHLDYWQKLTLLIGRARYGVLKITDGPDAEAKVLRDVILELRPVLDSDRPAFGKRPRRLRLYYGEPDVPIYSLLALHLDTKEADGQGLDEQNVAIDEALRRAEEWAAAA